MIELEISIGGRIFSVACDNDEQEKVKQAASLINEEADIIQSQLGRLPETKMLLLSALMIADRLGDVESDSKVFKEKSEDYLDLENKNKQLEQQKSSLENDYKKLEEMVVRILGKLENISSSGYEAPNTLLADESSTNFIEADQPKLF